MSTELKNALRKAAYGHLKDYKDANQAKKRALVRGNLEELIEFSEWEDETWEKLRIATIDFTNEPYDLPIQKEE